MTEKAPEQPFVYSLSVDLWFQVPIMTANFKGLVGSVPTAACCCPLGPFCVSKRDQVSSWVISPFFFSCVFTFCVFCVILPQVGLIGIWGGCKKKPSSRQGCCQLSGGGGCLAKRWLPGSGRWYQEVHQSECCVSVHVF